MDEPGIRFICCDRHPTNVGGTSTCSTRSTMPKCSHRFPVRSSKADQQSISLVILLVDLKANASELTRERFRAMYRKHSLPNHIADREFARIAGNKKAKAVPASRIGRDIRALKKAALPVRRAVNKVIAHTEEDRRLRGRLKYHQLDKTIELLTKTFEKYSSLLKGTYVQWLPSQYDVSSDLRKVWPNKPVRTQS